ncbi:MAG: hypothetical protein JWN29_2853 [Acidimicrobiales bacterium]|nr:hypothetical protein [Acidimicrobiales bacterium]
MIPRTVVRTNAYGSARPGRSGNVKVHELVEITCPPGAGCMAACSCGWQSGFYPSAGLAGSVWDAHVEADANQT